MQLHFQWPRGTHPFYLLAHVDFSSFEGRNFGEGCQRVMFPCKYCRGRAEELTVTKQISPYKVRLVNSSKSERPKLKMRRARSARERSERSPNLRGTNFCFLSVIYESSDGENNPKSSLPLLLSKLILSLIHNGERLLKLTFLYDTSCIFVSLFLFSCEKYTIFASLSRVFVAVV